MPTWRLVDRLHIHGERADRLRLRPIAWDEQIRDEAQFEAARSVLGQGPEALSGEPATRRARREELDAFYALWQGRAPAL